MNPWTGIRKIAGAIGFLTSFILLFLCFAIPALFIDLSVSVIKIKRYVRSKIRGNRNH